MLKATQTWDVRCPLELKLMFPREKRRGYWYKVSLDQMTVIASLLSTAYGIDPPTVRLFRGRESFVARHHHGDGKVTDRINGCYYPGTRTICVYARNHIKTIFHEFYHHLEEASGGLYDSSDRKRHGWIFGDLMWEAFRSPILSTEVLSAE